MNEFERVCNSMGLKINVGMSKVLMIKKDQMGSWEKIRVNGKEMQEKRMVYDKNEWLVFV